MLHRYSREDLWSFNRPAPPSIPQIVYSKLRNSGLCLFLLTKRPKKYRDPTDQKQSQPSEAAKLCLVNARPIVNKIEALNELIIDAQLDILAITETWLTPTNGDHNLASCCPLGFSAVHQPRFSTLSSLGHPMTWFAALAFSVTLVTIDLCLFHWPVVHHVFHLWRSLFGASAASTQNPLHATSSVLTSSPVHPTPWAASSPNTTTAFFLSLTSMHLSSLKMSS